MRDFLHREEQSMTGKHFHRQVSSKSFQAFHILQLRHKETFMHGEEIPKYNVYAKYERMKRFYFAQFFWIQLEILIIMSYF